MSVDRQLPEIRFEGFNGEWNSLILGENAKFTKGQGYSKGDLIEGGSPIILYGRLYTNYQTVITNVDTFVTEKDKSTKSVGGEVIVPASGESSEDISRAAVVRMKNVILGGDLNIVLPNKNIHSIFLALVLSNGRVKKELSSKAQGKSVVHIRNSDLSDLNIIVPSEDIEQKQIGDYFQKLDNLINQHQKKHDKLCNIKKAMLEKMFPKQGKTIPEIRFKGFSDEWKETKLFNEAIVTTGFPFDSADFSSSGTFLVITNGNIQNDSAIVDGKTGNRIAANKISSLSQYILNIGDILVTMDGTVGRTAKVIDTHQILAQRVGRLVAKNNNEFLYQSLNTGVFLEAMTTISHGGTIKHISLSEISNYVFFIPKSLEEQVKIGCFLKQLDNLIAQYQQQITKLKNIKQACLSKMFV